MLHRVGDMPQETSSLVDRAWRTERAAGTLVIPDGCWDIVAAPEQGTLRLVGVMTRPRRVTGDWAPRLIGLRLRPGVLKQLTGVCAHELRDQVVPLRDVAPRLAERIEREGLTLSGLRRAVLAYRRPAPDGASRPLRHALALLGGAARGEEGARVAWAAEAVGLSPRQLERLFLEHVGTSPKFYQRVMRLHAALRVLLRGPGPAEAAAAAGYADQAHFTREARVLTGHPPGVVRTILSSASLVSAPGG